MIKEALEYIVNLSAPHLEFRNGKIGRAHV